MSKLRIAAFTLTPIILAIFVNAIIYYNQWNRNNKDIAKNPFAPPGWTIALIWIMLLGILGATMAFVQGTPRIIIAITIAYCILYPFFTRGLQQAYMKELNIGAFLLACITWGVTFAQYKRASLAIIPLILWTSYVVAFL